MVLIRLWEILLGNAEGLVVEGSIEGVSIGEEDIEDGLIEAMAAGASLVWLAILAELAVDIGNAGRRHAALLQSAEDDPLVDIPSSVGGGYDGLESRARHLSPPSALLVQGQPDEQSLVCGGVDGMAGWPEQLHWVPGLETRLEDAQVIRCPLNVRVHVQN